MAGKKKKYNVDHLDKSYNSSAMQSSFASKNGTHNKHKKKKKHRKKM